MPEVVDANKVLEQLQIRDFQLVWYVENGLTPYDRFGAKKIINEIESHVIDRVIEVDTEIDNIKADKNSIWYNNDTYIQLLQSKKTRLIVTCKSLMSNAFEGFTKCFIEMDDLLKEKIVNTLMGALYMQEDVEKFKNAQENRAKERNNSTKAIEYAKSRWSKNDHPIPTKEMIYEILENRGKIELVGKIPEATVKSWIHKHHPHYQAKKPGRKPTSNVGE